MESSQRLGAVQSPIIPLIDKLTRKHAGTISFGQGVASYGPPPQAFRRVQQCLADPSINRYGPVEGIPELQHALAHKLVTENGIKIDSDNTIVVTAGSNMAFNTAVLAITDPGDEVIVPLPYYFNHEMSLVMEQCRPVLVPTDDNFHPIMDELEAAVTRKTRAIATISPNNPSGAVYTQEELAAINDLCKRRGIYHISDEAYENFCYDEHRHFSVASNPDTSSYTISLFSFSKGYGFAGWRIGYMVIPEHLLNAVKKIQDTILISPPVISQHAAIGALEAGEAFIHANHRTMSKKRETVLDALSGFTCLKNTPGSEGAFYVLLNIDTRMDDMELAKALIEKFRVATIPGSAFGIEQGCYLRLSYGALSGADTADGLERLKKGLDSLLV